MKKIKQFLFYLSTFIKALFRQKEQVKQIEHAVVSEEEKRETQIKNRFKELTAFIEEQDKSACPINETERLECIKNINSVKRFITLFDPELVIEHNNNIDSKQPSIDVIKKMEDNCSENILSKLRDKNRFKRKASLIERTALLPSELKLT